MQRSFVMLPEDRSLAPSQGSYATVIFTSGLGVGGAEMMLLRLSRKWMLEGYPIRLAVLGSDLRLRGRFENAGVKVLHLPFSRPLQLIGGLVSLIRELRVSGKVLLVGWMYHGNVFASLLRALIGSSRSRVIWNIRMTLDDGAWRAMPARTRFVIRAHRWLRHSAALIINNSSASDREHSRRLGIGECVRKVIPNGISIQEFEPSTSRRVNARNLLGIPVEDFVIGMVGRFHPQKDYATFFAAASDFASTTRNVRFVACGLGVDLQNPEFARLVGESVRPFVHAIGVQDDVAQIYAALDVFTLSSAFGEGFPNVLAEAMACQLPCVATDVGDSALVMGECGIVVPASRPDVLLDAWRRLHGTSPERLRQLGISARERVNFMFSLEAASRNFKREFDTVMSICAE